MAEAPFVEKVQYDREKRRADQAEAELADAKYGIEGHVEDKRKLRERAERAEAERDNLRLRAHNLDAAKRRAEAALREASGALADASIALDEAGSQVAASQAKRASDSAAPSDEGRPD